MPRRKSSSSSSEGLGGSRSSIRRTLSQRKMRLKTMSEDEKTFTRKITTKNGKWLEAQKTFRDFLNQKAKLRSFREFLKTEFSQENLDFWLEVEKYQQMDEGEERDEMASAIYKRFVKCGASEQVNLSHSARQSVTDRIQEPDADTFLIAQREIFRLIEQDSYRRFSQSMRQ